MNWLYKMNLLSIDTSTEKASVALALNGEVFCAEQDAKRQHAHMLLPMIECLLANSELHFNQLDAIVYGCGPGSFTGLRIACSVAKGLAYAQDLPLLPVSSLAAIANEVRVQNKIVKDMAILAVLDARMNQLYWACFADESTSAEEQVSQAADVDVANEKRFVLAGVGYESYLQQLPLSLRARLANHYTIYPHAQAMIRLALSGEIKTVSAAEALPVYVRNQIT
jgi:tRNA threonylcarbamoyladenosine biosynthesis protein TsaB